MMNSHVLCLTEISNIDPKHFEKDFNVYYTLRHELAGPQDKSGGVAILVKKDLPSELLRFQAFNNMEAVSCSLKLKDVDVSLSVIYKDQSLKIP